MCCFVLQKRKKSTNLDYNKVVEDMCKERLDEDLITTVKNGSASYNFRLPLKQRERKQKDNLWNEVSIYLKGKIILIIVV